MYAIVDIETTGGYAAAHGITEISIHVFDGNNVVEKFETLINPCQPIPVYIQAMTGITDEMVSSAPVFENVAERIHEFLHDKVFVAHNVNFEKSFEKMKEEKAIMFQNRLQKVFRHVSRQAKRLGVSCYRVYDHDLPEFPFCIEIYEDRLYMAEYKRQHKMNDVEHEEWLEESLDIVSDVTGIKKKEIFF